jgi:hypothetical protein
MTADKIASAIGRTLGFVALILLMAVLTAYPVKWLWNALMPELFNLKTISFAQAWGLMTLCSLLFKSTTSTQTETKRG